MAFTLAALFLLDVGMWVGFQSYQYYKTYPVRKLARGLEQMEKERELLFKNDLYGGKTPEETFVMYVEALKKGDLDLASRYFVLAGQAKELEGLKKMSPEQLASYVEKVEKIKETYKLSEETSLDTTKEYFYRIDNKWGAVRFRLNEFSKTWKIDYI